jgi:uncharacterized membrane protein YbhN (UPF0104 family)
LVELGVILLFAFAAAIYLYSEFPEMSIAVIASLIAVALGAFVVIPGLRFAREKFGEGAASRWPIVGTLLQIAEAEDTKEVLANLRGCLAPVGGLSALILVIQTTVIVVLAKSLSLDVSLPFLIMAWSLVTLAVTLPISVSGLGLREGVLVVMFTAVGESKEDALALGLLFFMVVMITRLPGAVTWFRGTASATASVSAQPADQGVPDANAAH